MGSIPTPRCAEQAGTCVWDNSSLLDGPCLFCSDMSSCARLYSTLHAHTQMTCLLECRLQNCVFPGLSSPLPELCLFAGPSCSLFSLCPLLGPPSLVLAFPPLCPLSTVCPPASVPAWQRRLSFLFPGRGDSLRGLCSSH